MARLDSWLSATVMHALGWALIHSLWQCLGLAALAAVLMAFSPRAALRYLIATTVLVAMLISPAATFVLLLKSQPAPRSIPTNPITAIFIAPESLTSPAAPLATVGATRAVDEGSAIVSPDSPKHFLPQRPLRPAFLFPILPWLVRAWLCGVALFSLRLAGGFLLLEYRRPPQSSVVGAGILAICQDLQRQLGINRAVRYLECGWLQAPAVIGWLRPVVLLPVSALTGLSEMQLRAVIAHELAHIRRLDPFVNLLQVLAETLLFYHPAIWWMNRRIRAEREFCCDEIAVSLTGDRIEYAKALTLMARGQAPRLAMAANRGPLSERILHILGQKPFGTSQWVLGLAGSVLFLATALGVANALFAIPHPAPHAIKPDLASSHIGSDHIPPVPGREPETLAEGNATDAALTVAPAVAAAVAPAPERTEASRRTREPLVRSRPQKLVLPLVDLSGVLRETLIQAVAANDSERSAPNMSVAAPRPQARTCALPSIADSVDLKEDPNGLRTVPVAINGTPQQFLLDLGTNPSQISQAAVSDLDLPSAGRPSGSGQGLPTDIDTSRVALFNVQGGQSAEDYRPHVRIASFTIGGATGHDLTFLVAKDPQLGKSKPYDGVVTGRLFKQSDVELDFIQNKLNYLSPTSCTDPNQVAYWPHAAVAAIPFTNSGGKIQVQVMVQGHSIPAVIDTTSSHTVMRRDIAELTLGLKADTPEMMPDGDVRDGTGLKVYRHTFPQISFAGGVTAYNVPALIQTNSMVHDLNRTPVLGLRATFNRDPSQRIPAFTLGMDVLSQLHLYVVPAQETLFVTQAESELGQVAAADASSGSSM